MESTWTDLDAMVKAIRQHRQQTGEKIDPLRMPGRLGFVAAPSGTLWTIALRDVRGPVEGFGDGKGIRMGAGVKQLLAYLMSP